MRFQASLLGLVLVGTVGCGDNEAAFTSGNRELSQQQNSGNAEGVPAVDGIPPVDAAAAGNADGTKGSGIGGSEGKDTLVDAQSDKDGNGTVVDAGNDKDGSGDAGGDDGDSDEMEEGPEGNLPPAPKPGAKEIVYDCAKNTKATAVHTLKYEARKDCRWGSVVDGEEVPFEGNLSIKNGYIRARESQKAVISLPGNAVICGVSLASKTDKIHFDDFFAFDVNNYVLAASKVIANALTADADGHNLYSWDKIVNKQMQDLGKYCATGSCALPEHDTQGNFDIGVSLTQVEDVDDLSDQEKMNAALFAKLSGAKELVFTATATGDNDDDDCAHSGGEFDLTVTYVQKQ